MENILGVSSLYFFPFSFFRNTFVSIAFSRLFGFFSSPCTLLPLTLPLSLYPLSDFTSSSSSYSRYPFLPPPSTIVFLLIFLFPSFPRLLVLLFSLIVFFLFLSFFLFFKKITLRFLIILIFSITGRGEEVLQLFFFYDFFTSFFYPFYVCSVSITTMKIHMSHFLSNFLPMFFVTA